MGVVQRIVFPALRIVIWAAIAVSLAVLAFGRADASDGAAPLTPSARLGDPTAEVATATVVNTVTVTGSVVADPATPVQATAAGTVHRIVATDGQRVDAGATLVEILEEVPQDPVVTTDPTTGAATTTVRPPKKTKHTITAPVSGTAHVSVLAGQAVSIGDQIGSVDPGTLSVSGTLTAAQQYRLIAPPTEAEVTLAGGPAPFTCTGLRLGGTNSGSGSSGSSGGGGSGVSVGGLGTDTGTGTDVATGTIACAIPPGTTAFTGLGATIAITNGTATDAVVVPITALQGTFQKGKVWVVGDDGAPTERDVSLGLTDGTVVQVTEGLTVGEQVLQFAPVQEEKESASAGCGPLGCGG